MLAAFSKRLPSVMNARFVSHIPLIFLYSSFYMPVFHISSFVFFFWGLAEVLSFGPRVCHGKVSAIK